MSNCVESSLRQAAISTFEDLGFMLADRVLSATQRAALEDATVCVDFRGPCHGRLILRVCGGVLPALTSNMLGGEDSPPEHLQRDALGEVANVICGNVLPLIAGSSAIFRLDAPRAGGEDGPAGAAAPTRVALGLEAGRAEVGLYLVEAPS